MNKQNANSSRFYSHKYGKSGGRFLGTTNPNAPRIKIVICSKRKVSCKMKSGERFSEFVWVELNIL